MFLTKPVCDKVTCDIYAQLHVGSDNRVLFKLSFENGHVERFGIF